jgi:hypothetical protein
MAAASPPWRGGVNQILYGVVLRAPADDEVVDRVATELIRQRMYVEPVQLYYDAAVEGLRSGEPLAFHDDDLQQEDAVRDFLTRLVRRLDERRPWPEHPFYAVRRDEWDDGLFGDAAIARVPLSPREIVSRLHRMFSDVDIDGGRALVLVLRLRTGHVVTLRATRFDAPYVDVLAGTDPASTTAAFREATGLGTTAP